MQTQNNKPRPNTLDDQRRAVIEAALPQVIFDGWSETTLERAAIECDLSPANVRVLFPRGGIDAIAFHSRLADAQVSNTLSADNDFAKLPVPLKIRRAIIARLELSTPHKEAVRKAVSILSWPSNAALSIQLLSETCDSYWRLAGDQATDINWYTKRITLAGIYSATLLFWLNDESGNLAATQAFLDRRLDNVKAFGKWKKACQERLSSLSFRKAQF